MRNMTDDHDAEHELRYSSALAAAAAVVNSSLDVEQVLDRILEQVSAVVPADTYNIILIRDGQGHMVRWRGYEALEIVDQITRVMPTIDGFETFRMMIVGGKPVVIPDTQASQAWSATSGRIDHRAYVGAPIRIDGVTEGFLNVNSARPGHFTARDGERLMAFANHAAIALKNARLYEAAQHHAAELEARVAERTAELAARTAWSEAILASTSDGIVVADSEGQILQMNPVARRWLERELSAENAVRLRDAIEAAAMAPATTPQPLSIFEGRDFELHAAPVSTETQPRAAVVVAVHDVSHLRALDRMKSQFIADVSHELRTPVAAVRLYASLLERGVLERREGYLASLQEATQRITRLVEGIVQIARLEAGHVLLEPTPSDLNTLATASVNSFAPIAEAQGLNMVTEFASDPIIVEVDPHWLHQALDHLIENAVRYTPAGEVRVTVRRVGPWAVCEIADTGLGIPAEETPRLFERFFRGEEARTRQIPGSGLGLSIARGIVQRHGGHIAVDSHHGSGSRFGVWLPLKFPIAGSPDDVAETP